MNTQTKLSTKKVHLCERKNVEIHKKQTRNSVIYLLLKTIISFLFFFLSKAVFHDKYISRHIITWITFRCICVIEYGVFIDCVFNFLFVAKLFGNTAHGKNQLFVFLLENIEVDIFLHYYSLCTYIYNCSNSIPY